jgi:hypothetical protein
MASTMGKMKIARPAARKSSGKNKPRSGSSRPSGRSADAAKDSAKARRPETPPPHAVAAAAPVAASEPANPRRRVVELPKVAGELPTPVATFYF